MVAKRGRTEVQRPVTGLEAPKTRYASDMPNIGPLEIVFLLLLALLLFGAKRLPEIGRSLGTGMREFKDSISGNTRELPSGTQEPVSRENDPVS